jgi:hypothetical protein
MMLGEGVRSASAESEERRAKNGERKSEERRAEERSDLNEIKMSSFSGCEPDEEV